MKLMLNERIFLLYLAFATTLTVLVLLVGCETLGIPKPETFAQRLAVGYSTVTTVRQTATTLVDAKKLGSADAQNVQTQADNARTGLDIARTMEKADPKAAEAKLSAVRTVLTALQSYLASKGKP